MRLNRLCVGALLLTADRRTCSTIAGSLIRLCVGALLLTLDKSYYYASVSGLNRLCVGALLLTRKRWLLRTHPKVSIASVSAHFF